MMRRAFLISRAALWATMLSVLAIALSSMFTASCQSPNFSMLDANGVGGMGGQAPTPTHCDNGVRDESETDRDCGGGSCAPCAVGQTCELPRDCENESCIGFSCQEPSCQDGETNFGETDRDCGGENCGATCSAGFRCLKDDDCSSYHCEAGTCQVATCDDRILNADETGTDCGGSCGGCPIGGPCAVSADCEAPPDGDPSAVKCSDRVCELVCPDDTGDCNERAQDGCEVDLLTSNNHCGGCGLDCDPEHAVGECIAGECLIKTDEPNQGCDDNYANCNLMPEDGCEVHLLTDVDHCGACEDSACSDEGGEATCSGGECSVECDEGYADCDENARDNGCETNTTNNVGNCGGCDVACEVTSADYAAFCTEGECGETLCDPGQGDCDGDGDCSDSLISVAHCGGCGLACTVAHGSPDCVETSERIGCAIDVCDAANDEAWADCDGSYTTGCEVNTLTNRFRCGGCLAEEGGSGQDCSTKEGTQNVSATTCSAGSCQVVGCNSGWGDCDGLFSNGCDTNLDTHPSFCGACNIDCTDKVGDDNVAQVSCQAGACQVDDCSGTRLDCDGNFANGCEVNPASNPVHCGGCNDASGVNCNAKIGDDDVAEVSCNSGACKVLSCSANRADCDGNFANGCEVNTNNDETHCGGCAGAGGDTCEPRLHASEACQSGSCNYDCDSGWADLNGDRNDASGSDGCESRDLTVLNYGSWGSSDTGGDGPAVTFSHTLEGAPGTQRLILVGVLCRGNSTTDCALTTATYGSTQLTSLGSVFLIDSSVRVLYALDSALPAAGNYTVTINRNDEWGSLAAHVIEFNGAEQQTFFADHGGATKDANCSSGTDASVSLSGLPPGSIVYAVGGGHGPSGDATANSPLSLASNHAANYIVLGAGYSSTVSGSVTAQFDFTGCYRSVLYAVGVRPESDY